MVWFVILHVGSPPLVCRIPASSSQYSTNLTFWLSPIPDYTTGITCAQDYSYTGTAPARATVTCAQTISNARFVSVWRPLLSATNFDRMYIWELRVVRYGMFRVGNDRMGLCALTPDLLCPACRSGPHGPLSDERQERASMPLQFPLLYARPAARPP